MSELQPGDAVEFAGPPRAVQQWPQHAERGVVSGERDGIIRVVWERSKLMVAWPAGWLRRLDAPQDGSTH